MDRVQPQLETEPATFPLGGTRSGRVEPKPGPKLEVPSSSRRSSQIVVGQVTLSLEPEPRLGSHSPAAALSNYPTHPSTSIGHRL
ncbi:hypothetical protein AMTR_s00097p00170770 [Amborella trichopoda]|uniref:Uncharacterized protein n=1 Tax=Amborella trichopoda TaxID=13333 RepID=W1NVW4_AMBTC|nr:hypothetical protein AMTR_s00097p00170770 [Amborella trichopoda]